MPRINYRGSYRRLAGNSMSAMMAAVEIYNEPQFNYCDEVSVTLVMNAWELLLKTIVSKAGKSIFEKKEKGQPYRTLPWGEAFRTAAASALWPFDIPPRAAYENIELLALCRNNSIYFYDELDFGKLLYSLLQTSLFNYRDLVKVMGFGDLSNEANWQILLLGFEAPFDAVKFLAGKSKGSRQAPAVEKYIAGVRDGIRNLEAESIDTGRFLTEYQVHLVSTKKIAHADITVGFHATDESPDDAVVIPRHIDPNESRPYLQKDIVARLPSIPGFQQPIISGRYLEIFPSGG